MSTNETAATERPGLPEIPKSLRPFAVVVGMAAVMWVLEIIDTIPHTNLDRWGIQPRTLRGLPGILFAPFLHTGFPHLIGNTIPFIVLGSIIALSGTQRFLQVTVIIGLASGLAVWLIGPAHSYTVGASSLVFGYVTYLVARGFFERKILYLVGGLIVAFVYGTV
ncbi:MAG TPA: rhomboid family intramembrane serine protease, partial [Acidimicrobiales bacterium]